ncbi:MAG: hypothetical protein OHK0039_29680 [Bacteroidia bacterium]
MDQRIGPKGSKLRQDFHQSSWKWSQSWNFRLSQFMRGKVRAGFVYFVLRPWRNDGRIRRSLRSLRIDKGWLLERTGQAIEDFTGEGKVYIDGKVYAAHVSRDIFIWKGTRIRVVGTYLWMLAVVPA